MAKGVIEEIEEIDESDEELDESEDLLGDSDEVEGGIFDEDLDHVEEEESSSGFDIGTTILSSPSPVESWAGQNLEEVISRERVEKDWGDSDEFVAGDFYKSSDDKNDFYGSSTDFYSSGNAGAKGAYDESSSYSAGKAEGSYVVPEGGKGRMKNYEQIENDRRSGKSMLELDGFNNNVRKKQMESRGNIVLSDKDVA
jgi:hypothetical protein